MNRARTLLCDLLRFENATGKKLILDTLRQTGGSVVKAAKILDVSVGHLRRDLREQGLLAESRAIRDQAKKALDPFWNGE